MPLTDIVCRNTKPGDKPKKLADGEGLYLEVMPSGGKYWRMKYRFAGKEKRLAIGVYPAISLLKAREQKTRARKLLMEGIDPSSAKKQVKQKIILNQQNNFEAIAREWHERQTGAWTPLYAKAVLKRLEKDVFPAIGHRPIADITAPELLAALRTIEKGDALDLAHRAHQMTGQIFRYAIATGRAERDISVDLRGALKTRKKEHYAHLEARELPAFFDALHALNGNVQTKLAIELLIHTFVRTIELRGARWEEIDFDKAEWRIPAERMKMREKHIVPLSPQALAILHQLHKITGWSEYVFPSQNRQKMPYMSENTILHNLYRMGYKGKVTAHGFRATASTILNEHGFRPDVIEKQLAHGERNEVRASYNHAQYLPERREMMQWWSTYLDNTATGTHTQKVVMGRFGKA